MIRPPTVAVATPSTGFSRTVTVELLLMHSPSVWLLKSRPIFGHDRQCYEKTTLSGNPAILRGCGVRHPGGHSQFSTREPRGHAKWVKSPHGPATVSGYASPDPRLRCPTARSQGSPLSFGLGRLRERGSMPRVRKPDPGGVTIHGA